MFLPFNVFFFVLLILFVLVECTRRCTLQHNHPTIFFRSHCQRSVLECHPPSLSPISSNYVLCNILCVGLKSYPVVNQWVVLQTKGVMQAKLDNQEIRWHGGVRLKFVSMVNC